MLVAKLVATGKRDGREWIYETVVMDVGRELDLGESLGDLGSGRRVLVGKLLVLEAIAVSVWSPTRVQFERS